MKTYCDEKDIDFKNSLSEDIIKQANDVVDNEMKSHHKEDRERWLNIPSQRSFKDQFSISCRNDAEYISFWFKVVDGKLTLGGVEGDFRD